MRLVPTKTPEQQSGLVLHRTQHLFIRKQTSMINAIRAHCAEFGIVAPVGRRGVEELLNVIANANGKQVPKVANGNRSIQDDLGRYLLERSSVALHWSAVSFTSPTNLFVNSLSVFGSDFTPMYFVTVSAVCCTRAGSIYPRP
jgi:hypothetical protein